MFCMDCKIYATRDAQKKGPFVLGTQHFKLQSIKEHMRNLNITSTVHISQ